MPYKTQAVQAFTAHERIDATTLEGEKTTEGHKRSAGRNTFRKPP